MHLFPPPLDKARLLDSASFEECFSREWSRLKRKFIKLERLQSYSEPGDPSYEAFLRGNSAEAVAQLRKRIAAQKPLYDQIREKNIQCVQLRIVESPISSYLRYEFKSYSISASYGEDIRIVKHEDAANLLRATGASDFVLFDDKAALVYRYNASGFLLGAFGVTDPALVEAYVRIAESILSAGRPLSQFLEEYSEELAW